MSESSTNIDVFIESKTIKDNPLCPEIIQVLKKVRPTWYGADSTSVVKAKVGQSKKHSYPLV